MMAWIVQLEAGVWLAQWAGDPGRTLVRETAKRFPSITSARRGLDGARRLRFFPQARIEEVNE
jgi:hypothetical protein